MASEPPPNVVRGDAGDAGEAGILIVDDRPENLVALSAVLEPLGERLVCASSGEEALRALLRDEFAVILLDVRLGGIDGLQTAQLIRARPRTRDIPIIFLTAEATDVSEIARAYETAGPVDYLIKPFEPEILRAKVRVLVQLIYERAERSRQSRARAEAEASARTIRTLQILSDAALSHLDVDGLVSELVQRACAVFDLAGAVLLLRSEASGELEIAARTGAAVPPYRDGLAADREGVDAVHRFVTRRSVTRVRASDLASTDASAYPHDAVASVVVVPLAVEHEPLGALVLGGSEVAASSIDLELLGLAGNRMAIAIDHAQRAQQGRALVETLQRNLLPENLPAHPRVELTARYLPSGAVREIGGDWYDAVELGPDQLAIMIGDVVGHGIRAATTMSELRSALRAYMLEGHPPAQALHQLDRLAQTTFGTGMVATAACLSIDVAEHVVTIARAGHPSPAVRAANGQARLLEDEPSLPLGLGAAIPAETRHALAPGDTLLLFTDGLVERRHESITKGFDRLIDALASAPLSLDGLCDHLTQRGLPAAETMDDAALVAVRLRTPESEPLALTLPAIPGSIPLARHRLRAWLNDAIADTERPSGWMGDVELALSEAATNAVRHAYGPRDATFSVAAMRTEQRLVIEVADHGRWRPPRDSHGGRGLPLIEAICDELQIDRTDDGTRVTIKFSLPPPSPSQ